MCSQLGHLLFLVAPTRTIIGSSRGGSNNLYDWATCGGLASNLGRLRVGEGSERGKGRGPRGAERGKARGAKKGARGATGGKGGE